MLDRLKRAFFVLTYGDDYMNDTLLADIKQLRDRVRMLIAAETAAEAGKVAAEKASDDLKAELKAAQDEIAAMIAEMPFDASGQ